MAANIAYAALGTIGLLGLLVIVAAAIERVGRWMRGRR
jgi:hypothetical protein